jgi:hypothetical protein
MRCKILSLTLRHAIQGSSDATPAFVQSLNQQWLPQLGADLTHLKLVHCALHSAETLFHCKDGASGMRGAASGGPEDTCQFADLAAAAPGLTSLDLSGNLLTRVPDEDYEFSAGGSIQMGFLAAMVRSLPKLKCVRLGLQDEETSLGKACWSVQQVEKIRAALPAGCIMLDDAAGSAWRMKLVDGFSDYVEAPTPLPLQQACGGGSMHARGGSRE